MAFKSSETDVLPCKGLIETRKGAPVKLPNAVLSPAPTFQPAS